MKLGLDQTALKNALYERLSRLPGVPSEELAKELSEVITQAIELNNRAVQRQLEGAGLRFRE